MVAVDYPKGVYHVPDDDPAKWDIGIGDKKNRISTLALPWILRGHHNEPFFRYPGGKSKLSKRIARIIFDSCGAISDYREPFFGGGSVGLEVMEHLGPGTKVWINDKDDTLMDIWQAVVENPHSITDPITGYEPRLTDFYEFKHRLTDPDDKNLPQDRAIMHLVVRQTSFSGLGIMSGGPMGGRLQKSKDYKVNARWSPNAMSKKIMQAHRLFESSMSNVPRRIMAKCYRV